MGLIGLTWRSLQCKVNLMMSVPLKRAISFDSFNLFKAILNQESLRTPQTATLSSEFLHLPYRPNAANIRKSVKESTSSSDYSEIKPQNANEPSIRAPSPSTTVSTTTASTPLFFQFATAKYAYHSPTKAISPDLLLSASPTCLAHSILTEVPNDAGLGKVDSAYYNEPPHQESEALSFSCGDDALIAGKNVLGIADGVTGWKLKAQGHAALWSRLILHRTLAHILGPTNKRTVCISYRARV